MTLALFGIENDGLNLAVNLLVFFALGYGLGRLLL
jgi:hypothetical protein